MHDQYNHEALAVTRILHIRSTKKKPPPFLHLVYIYTKSGTSLSIKKREKT